MLTKEVNKILKSLCYVKHVNFINLDPNWIQGNRSFNPELFYLNKLHLVAKRHFVPVKCISTSVGNICEIKNMLQLKKANKPVSAFLINNADFPPLIFLPARDLFPDYISVLSSNSVENFLIKPTSKPFYASYNKYFCKVVCKCSISETSLFTGNECGHVSVNNIICKRHVTSDSKCTVSVLCKNIQKPFGKYFCRYNLCYTCYVANGTTSSTYQYTNPDFDHSIVHKSVRSTFHVNTYPIPVVALKLCRSCSYSVITHICYWHCNCRMCLSCSH